MSTTDHAIEYVTATIGGQLFGLPISGVQDVFMPERLTRVPLAAPEFAGMLNLRGRIVTAVDMRLRLGLAPAEAGQGRIARGVGSKGGAHGPLVWGGGGEKRLSGGEFGGKTRKLE